MHRERTVIVGASLAGTRAAGALRQAGYPGHILIVGDELELPYHRPPLSKELLGARPPTIAELRLEPRDWFADHGLELWLGQRAVGLDTARRELSLASGARLGFDQLLIASGARPRRLTVPGSDARRVLALRTLADARGLAAELDAAEHVVVIGAGLLGLEVAAAARAADKRTTVVERGAAALPRLGGPALGARVARLHRDHGVDLRLGAEVAAIGQRGDRLTVELDDGARLPADVVVVAIGTAPATDWLAGSGVPVDDGVLVDEHGATAVAGVFAAGDVARAYHPGLAEHLRHESYAAAHDHGVAVGRTMAGRPTVHAPLAGGGSTQYGVRIQACGRPGPGDALVLRGEAGLTPALGFQLRDGAVVAAFALDRARDFAAARRLVAARERVDAQALADDALPLAALVGAGR